jgi:hypothetical protein
MYNSLREENKKLLEENTRLTKRVVEEEMKQLDLVDRLFSAEFKFEKLNGENRYLLQRLKELRHKTWFPVYEENLKLQQELEQYKTVLSSVETFIGQYSKEKKGDKGCH